MDQAYRIVRSNRRTLALQVLADGAVVVRAPLFSSERDISRFVEEHRLWIDRAKQKQKKRMLVHPEPDADEVERFKALACEILPEKVAYFAKIMGVTVADVRITSAKTRFGSCNAKGNICFSWRLMQYPNEAIDYVVVHELAHRIHLDHSKAFYAVVESVLPDYRERKKLLKV